MITKISDSVWKVPADSNIYMLEYPERIIIDTGSRANRYLLDMFLSKAVDFSEVKKVFFTHLHYDHIGNFDLFPNAGFFASEAEIEDFRKSPRGATLADDSFMDKFNVELKPIPEIEGLEVIQTPGHTRGSVCFWFAKEGVLFTGDTLLNKGHGRTDLPTSVPGEMQRSLNRLVAYNYRVLACGHEY
ncbi:MAG: MBL fold metallo-hydrolase [archaeon]